MSTISLPRPNLSGDISIEETLERRRSVRTFSATPLSLEEIGQLAWAAQGITDAARGFRTAPSAGATFPMETYFLLTEGEDVAGGVYRYLPHDHALELVTEGDQRRDLRSVALQQESITDAPAVLVITGILSRIEPRYRERAMRFMHMEAGHVAQNIYLQGVSLGVGTVVIGAFEDDGVRSVLGLGDGEYPLYIMPLGKLP